MRACAGSDDPNAFREWMCSGKGPMLLQELKAVGLEETHVTALGQQVGYMLLKETKKKKEKKKKKKNKKKKKKKEEKKKKTKKRGGRYGQERID